MIPTNGAIIYVCQHCGAEFRVPVRKGPYGPDAAAQQARYLLAEHQRAHHAEARS